MYFPIQPIQLAIADLLSIPFIFLFKDKSLVQLLVRIFVTLIDLLLKDPQDLRVYQHLSKDYWPLAEECFVTRPISDGLLCPFRLNVTSYLGVAK